MMPAFLGHLIDVAASIAGVTVGVALFVGFTGVAIGGAIGFLLAVVMAIMGNLPRCN